MIKKIRHTIPKVPKDSTVEYYGPFEKLFNLKKFHVFKKENNEKIYFARLAVSSFDVF